MNERSIIASLVSYALDIVKSYFLVLVFLLPVFRGLFIRYTSPLRRYPGPFIASCSRIWKIWVTYRGHSEHDHIEIHRKYGTVVRTGPNELSFASPNAAKDIFAVGKGVQKTDFYWVFPPAENPDIFTEIREWKHAQMKRFAVKPYALASVKKMVPSIENVERELLQKLDDFADRGRPSCDLGDWLHWFAFDVLGEVAFSHRYGFVATGTDVEGCIQYIDDIQFYDGLVGQAPWLHYLLRLNPLAQHVFGLGLKDTLLTRMVAEELRSRNGKERGGAQKDGPDDLLTQLIEAHRGAPDKFTEADVFSIAFGAIGAGSDSTASTMQSFFWLLLNSPKAYEKLMSEIDSAHSNGRLSEMISYEEAQDLPYFQACLEEAMRLRPAVGLNIYRKLPAEGLYIDGQYYPGGTEVAVNGWVLHRDKQVFGPDAEVYRPERWLEPASKEMHRHMYQFGGGSHLCLGRNLALLEMNKLLPQLLRRYSFELEHPGRPLKHRTTFFVIQSGLKVKMSRRDSRDNGRLSD